MRPQHHTTRTACRRMRWRDHLRIKLGAIRQRTIPGIIAFVLTGGKVSSGPLAGMNYILSSIGSALAPKLLGTYEAELHAVVEQFARTSFTSVVDVGAAEGYYAVGFARCLANVPIVAFEQEETGRRLLAKLASVNGVSDRIEVRGRCETHDLQAALKPGSLLITDVEGYERVLIDPVAVPALKGTTILTEVHGEGDALGHELCARLAATHRAQWIKPLERPLRDWTSKTGPAWLAAYLQWEHRPSPFYWIVFQPITPS